VKDKTHRVIFNSVVEALTKAGHKDLPIYDLAAGSFYWWLKTTSRKTAASIIQQVKTKRFVTTPEFQATRRQCDVTK
jgi:hypothetical protein